MDNKSEAASVSGISIQTDTGIIERRKWSEWFRTTCIWRFFEKLHMLYDFFRKDLCFSDSKTTESRTVWSLVGSKCLNSRHTILNKLLEFFQGTFHIGILFANSKLKLSILDKTVYLKRVSGTIQISPKSLSQ